jgi:two-component system, OmpR family, response regulator VicR
MYSEKWWCAMRYQILLVEDDVSISEMVEHYLQKEGFHVCKAFDGAEAVQLFAEHSFDLILLDMMLPKLDGTEFLKIAREKSAVPILILSAKDSDVDKALGLGFGADDYIAKPFSMIELTARIKAAIRRATQYTGQASQAASGSKSGATEITNASQQDKRQLTVGDLTMDRDNYTVRKKEKPIKLTAKEFHILKLLMENPKRVFTKAQIYNLIWDDDYFGDENVINVHISRLREKIEDDPGRPLYIKTLWGIGYRLGEF